MRNDPRFHRGPCPVPTPIEKERVRKIIADLKETLKKRRGADEGDPNQ